MRKPALSLGVALWCMACALASPGASAQSGNADLSTASLEQLTQMKISFSSFARKDEDLWKTPAAVYVITNEDIARSAASSIPELLRMVPGMQVAQIDASSWAVSARGFNSVYADKLLVLIDGRTVYTEIYSGAHWDEIDLPLSDVDRIEVVRGPGAAVWGTNAVNGVINIITKKVRSTLGEDASGRIDRINDNIYLRHGGSLGQRVQYRVFASYIDRRPFETTTGADAYDGEDTVRGGFRLDWQRSAADWITTSGDLYGGHLKEQIIPEIALYVGPNNKEEESIAGGHFLSRWEHKSRASDMAFQAYYDDQSRHELATYVRTRTFDIDYQDHLTAGPRNDVVWGGEYRFTDDHLRAAILPTTRPDYDNYLVDGFVQDEIAIVPQRLTATIGSKVQKGTLAGFQVQPSARILWASSNSQSLWAAISSAAVAPSIQDKYISLPLNAGTENRLPIVGLLQGNPHFKPESVLAYEIGYRRKIAGSLTLDVAGFYNVNRRIQALTTTASSFVPLPAPHIQAEFLYTNGYKAMTQGIESTATWKPRATLSFEGSYTWMQAHTTQVGPGIVTILDTWSSPRNTFAGSASWIFAPHWSANGFVSYVGSLQANDAGSIVPAYTRLDLHVGRKLGRQFQLDVGGTNFLTPRHFEFLSNTGFITPSEVPRSVFLRGAWIF